MQNQFVTYEIAKRLKELGFNEPCILIFNNKKLTPIVQPEGGILFKTVKNIGLPNKMYAAPLWQQMIDWLRKNHWIFIIPNHFTSYAMRFEIKQGTNTILPKFVFTTTEFATQDYKEALQAAILKALELIKK